MTILEAKEKRVCIGCIYRLVGTGPHQCMGVNLGDTECPGPCRSDKRQTDKGV